MKKFLDKTLLNRSFMKKIISSQFRKIHFGPGCEVYKEKLKSIPTGNRLLEEINKKELEVFGDEKSVRRKEAIVIEQEHKYGEGVGSFGPHEYLDRMRVAVGNRCTTTVAHELTHYLQYLSKNRNEHNKITRELSSIGVQLIVAKELLELDKNRTDVCGMSKGLVQPYTKSGSIVLVDALASYFVRYRKMTQEKAEVAAEELIKQYGKMDPLELAKQIV